MASSPFHADHDGLGRGRWPIRADARELSGLRGEIERLLAANGIDAESSAEIVLAVNEAAANAIEHGARGDAEQQVVVEATLDGDGLTRFVVSDQGTWRPPPVVTNRGRGIDLMRAVMDDVRIDTSPHGTTVSLARRRTPAPIPSEPVPTEDADTVVFPLPRDVDHFNALELSARIRSEASDVRKLILDFSETGFFDSAAVALVVRVVQHRRASNLPTVAVAPSNGPVRAVLRISGLDELLDICDSVAAAKARIA